MSITLADMPARAVAEARTTRPGPLALLVSWIARRRAVSELSALSDRELDDIGLTRGQIGDAVGARFRLAGY